jgi:quinol monooxygenase YgiN
MNRTIRFAVDLTITEGKLDAFQAIAQQMTAGTQKEPGALVYDWYFSADRKRCRLLETYSDAKAMKEHVQGPVVQQLVPKLLEVSKLTRFEVYGEPDSEDAKTLQGVGAEIFAFWNGVSR